MLTEDDTKSTPAQMTTRDQGEDQDYNTLEQQIRTPITKISYTTLFRYATRLDVLGLTFSAASAIAGGAVLPLLTLLFGGLTVSFRDFFSGTVPPEEAKRAIDRYSLYFVYLAIGEFLTVFTGAAGFSIIGERVTTRIRESYLEAILHQNVGYFDNAGAGEISTRISTDMNLIQDGISEKVALVLAGIAAFLSALIISFVKSWKLSLIVMSSLVALILAMGGGGTAVAKLKSKALQEQASAGNLVEETITSIRTATAFGAQDILAARFDNRLNSVERRGFEARSAAGIMLGVASVVVYMEHALSFWQGSRFLVGGVTSLSAVITIQLAMMMGGAWLGNSLPHFQALATAVAAGEKVFSTIDRKSPLDSRTDLGDRLQKLEGRIDFKDTTLIYPTRPDLVVLRNLNLSIPAGKVTAIVGRSGSGKSSLVALLQRFYLPIHGSIEIDGHNLDTLNLRWLRQQMSMVGQEPVLFSCSVFQNIAFGLVGTKHEVHSDDVMMGLVVQAAKTANAHDFISAMPDGYATEVGNRGFLLSGGQKQRIAIARAIISDPSILLLDEATSALDTKSEAAVQAAIDKAAKGRTTIIIAHRLSTIREADSIVVMDSGEVVEQGSHNELLANGGVYSSLVRRQTLNSKTVNSEDGSGGDLQVPYQHSFIEKASISNSIIAKSLNEKASTALEICAPTQSQQDSEYSLRNLIKFAWSLNRQDKWTVMLGTFCSILCGGNQPARGIIFGHSIIAISLPLTQKAQIRHDSNFWAGMFLVLAFVQLFASSGQGIAFALSSERLIGRAQSLAFRSLLRQDIAFFDRKENAPGRLASLLSSDASRMAGISGATIGAVMVFLVTVFGCLIVALGFGWKLSLVCASVMPVLIACGFMRFLVLAKYDERSKRTTDAAGLGCEAASALRTVASLTIEKKILQEYHELLLFEARKDAHTNIQAAAAYALSQSFFFLSIALGFWYGGHLVADREYNSLQFFICFTETLFGAQAAGVILSFAPEIGSGRSAVENFKRLVDSKPMINPLSQAGEVIDNVEGRLEFKSVSFRYAERQSQQILTDLSFEVKPGQFVALVGASGSGKSTVISLIERFYDPESGSILLDGSDIKDLKVQDYRSHIALVSQEANLYTGTIRDNLRIGAPTATEEDMIVACKAANIYDFVVSLPEGLDTLVGPKGGSVSGGQKQRLAIARALLRKPKVLLLDEATSALDSESEQAVEEALRTASKGRTTIAIAHRISSIYHADTILVLEQGTIIEKGSHAELMALAGRYYDMVSLQSLDAHP